MGKSNKRKGSEAIKGAREEAPKGIGTNPLAKRTALQVAWNRGRVDTLNRVFGCRVCTPEEKPTNGEFIAMIADKLSLERSA